LIRGLAEKCNFKHAKKYTMRSCQREMLTKMSGKCDQKTMNVSGRHKLADANALYQEENNAMHTRRNKLLHFTDPNEDKRKKTRRKSRRKLKNRRRNVDPLSSRFRLLLPHPRLLQLRLREQ